MEDLLKRAKQISPDAVRSLEIQRQMYGDARLLQLVERTRKEIEMYGRAVNDDYYRPGEPTREDVDDDGENVVNPK